MYKDSHASDFDGGVLGAMGMCKRVFGVVWAMVEVAMEDLA